MKKCFFSHRLERQSRSLAFRARAPSSPACPYPRLYRRRHTTPSKEMDPSALSAGRAVFTLDLAPAAAGAGAAGALAGAKAALARRLLRWSPDLGGVLLGIKDERLVGGLVSRRRAIEERNRARSPRFFSTSRPRPPRAISHHIASFLLSSRPPSARSSRSSASRWPPTSPSSVPGRAWR